MYLAQRVGVEFGEKVYEEIKESAISFFGTEHRLREEEMEEQFNREAKDG